MLYNIALFSPEGLPHVNDVGFSIHAIYNSGKRGDQNSLYPVGEK